MSRHFTSMSLIALLLSSALAGADEQAAASEAAAKQRVTVPLRIQAVFETQVGGEKRSRIPYEFTCLANGPSADLRIGVEVPIAVRRETKENKQVDWQYRSVGAKIHCIAQSLNDRQYLITLHFEQSSIRGQAQQAQAMEHPDVPIFTTWDLTSGEILRDGQTVRSALGTDPNSGETGALEITIKVAK